MRAVLLVLAIVSLATNGICADAPSAETNAVTAAQARGQYTVLILHKNDGQDVLETAFKDAVSSRADVFVHSAEIKSPTMVALLEKHKIDIETMPTPVAMVLSSNNVVTGIFTKPPKAEKLKEVLLPEQPLAVRKALADGKAVLIKAQSKATTGNAETDKAISEYLADKSISNKVTVIQVDLDKADNAPFLKTLKIDAPNEKQSVVICMAPPLKIVNKAFRGAATKDIIVKASAAACGTGCGTSG